MTRLASWKYVRQQQGSVSGRRRSGGEREILDRVERCRFCDNALSLADQTFTLAQCHKDTAARRLTVGNNAGEVEMLEKILLEQCVAGLPSGTLAITLAENYLAVHHRGHSG